MTPTREAVGWLLRVTRPVLSPLGLSVVFRHVERLAGLGLLAVGAGAVTRLAADVGGLSAVDPGWLPRTATGLVVLLVVLALVKGMSRYLEQFFAHLVAFTALELLRVEVYRALVPQAPMVMHASTSGDLMVRATKDVDRIEVFFAHTFPPAITAVTIPLIGVGVVGTAVSWPVAGLLAVGLLVSGLAVPWLGASRSLTAAGRAAERRGRLGQHLTDSLQGMAEVTGYGHATRRLDEMAALDAQIAADEAPRARVHALRAGLQSAVMAGTTLAVALTGLAAGLDVVSLAVTVAVAWKLFDSTAPVSEFMAVLDASLAAARRVHQVVTAPPAVSDPKDPRSLPAGPLSVSWQGIGYRYPGAGVAREAALEDVTVEVPAGSHCCLVGVSGSGKSTLMSLALRVDDPSDGAVLIGGVDARRVRLDDLRSRLVLVSQQTHLMPGTIAENLRLAAPEANEEQLWAAVRVAQLDAEIRAMPDALATVVGEHGQRISGGQRQRLALARALLGPADVFLLDEFTAHLDPALAARVRSSLRAARPGATLIESTHDLDRIADADQVVALDRGRIAPELLERLRDG